MACSKQSHKLLTQHVNPKCATQPSALVLQSPPSPSGPSLSPKGSFYAGCVPIADSRVTENDPSGVRVGSESWPQTRAQGPPGVTRQVSALPSGLMRATSGWNLLPIARGVQVLLGIRGRAPKTPAARPDCANSSLWSLYSLCPPLRTPQAGRLGQDTTFPRLSLGQALPSTVSMRSSSH